MPLLGHLALWVALLAGVWGAATGFAAGPMHRTDLAESARRAGVALGVALGTAVVALLVAILRQNFNVAYVAVLLAHPVGGDQTIEGVKILAFWGVALYAGYLATRFQRQARIIEAYEETIAELRANAGPTPGPR